MLFVGAEFVVVVDCVDPVSMSILMGEVSYSTFCTVASGAGRKCGMMVEKPEIVPVVPRVEYWPVL